MNFRVHSISLALSLYTTSAVSAASNGAWNCEQSQSGEWTCLNQTPASGAPPQPQVIKTQPAPPATAQQAKPAPTEVKPEVAPVRQAEPKPVETEPAPIPQVAQPVPAVPPEREKVKVVEKAVSEAQKLRVKVNEPQKPAAEPVQPKSQTASSGTVPGWTCKTGDDKSGWNCNLVGADPKGEARPVSEVETELAATYWLTPTFSYQQERSFQTLRGEFDRDPWQNCSTWGSKKRKIKATSQEARDAATTDVTADFSEVYDGEVLNFAGNVDLTRADQHLIADKASYDTVAETLDAQGNVLYSEDQLALFSETASLSLGKDEARLRKALFVVPEAPFRGSADVVYRDSKSLSRYNEAAFTSCSPGNQDWIMHASRVKINRESGQGSAKNAWLEFKGVPVLYTPYISFPTDSRRLSGLLAPTWGTTQRNGFDASAPFYWNIAPNFDDIITLRYMSKRGEQIRNKFRYLTETSQGTFSAEFLPYDEIADKTRYSGSWQNKTIFTPNLSSTLNLNYVSDKTYFNDLNNALGFQDTRFLPSTAYLNYGISDFVFAAGIQHYQAVDKTITDAAMPYNVLPRINLNYSHVFEDLPISVAMDNQYSYFSHDVLVNAQRYNLAPAVALPIESDAGFLIPRLTGQYTQYQLSNQTNLGQASSVSRFLPIFSLDTGLTFEKELNFAGSPYIHTLEPRLFYLYIPRKDQSNIPIFDTSFLDTNFYSLFRENRFSGFDRIQDANQVTLAITSRYVDSTTGLEPLKVNLGQILYFQNRSVDLDYLTNNTKASASNTSNFIGELSGQLSRNWSYSTGLQWDPEYNRFARGQAMLKYRKPTNELLSLGYRYRRNPNDFVSNAQVSDPTLTINQTDVSFRLPLFGEWYGLGRWQYSLTFDKTTESFIGIEKENCCWRFRVIGRRYINAANNITVLNDPSTKPETAFFVQLELKGLSSFGDSVDTFLNTNLYGYRKASFFE
ncbi:LPS assembly protein LptD [Methylomonas sp. CM2]|uniref:LPS-assembly protein LptD n=1 Tax=Methylomonas sp. CM2 TaxID=3417647 RepID=UPI003CF0122A